MSDIARIDDSTEECHMATYEPFLKDEDAVTTTKLDARDCRKSTNRSLLNIEDKTHSNFEDLDKGWAWVVLAGCFGTFSLMGTTQFASGIIHMILLEKYNSSVSLASVAGAVHVSIISLGGW